MYTNIRILDLASASCVSEGRNIHAINATIGNSDMQRTSVVAAGRGLERLSVGTAGIHAALIFIRMKRLIQEQISKLPCKNLGQSSNQIDLRATTVSCECEQ